MRRPVGYTPRRTAGLAAYERVLARAGLGPVAGVDEAGRGACAGPLVVAAVVLDRWAGGGGAELADSKALTARAREAAYRRIVRSARAWCVVVIGPDQIDGFGLHACNVAGMRRALAGLADRPGYALTDGFEVPGLAVPALAMWKGDQVAACIAAASIVAKVTRDEIMRELNARYPGYGFARHKGYSTPSHMAALDALGPSPVHRRSFVNVLSRLAAGERVEDVIEPAAVVPAEPAAPGDGAAPGDPGSAGEGAEYAGRGAALDAGQGSGPIVELFAGSRASAAGSGAWTPDRAPASAEGRR